MKNKEETWLDIKNYGGLYQVSNMGNIKSLSRCWKSGGHISSHLDMLLKLKKDYKGYLNVTLFKNGKQKTFRVHRLVGEAFIPNPENKPQINHKYGVRNDNRVSELEWVTQSENTKHAYEIGLIPKGEQHSLAKLNVNLVLDIIKKYETGNYSQRDLNKEYGVSQSTINNILNKKIWKNVKII